MNKTISNILNENNHPVKILAPKNSNLRKLFITAFLQVLLVSANAYFISRVAWLGVVVCGFGISYIWTLNVKKISASSQFERIAYASGASIGGVVGLALSKYGLELIKSMM